MTVPTSRWYYAGKPEILNHLLNNPLVCAEQGETRQGSADYIYNPV